MFAALSVLLLSATGVQAATSVVQWEWSPDSNVSSQSVACDLTINQMFDPDSLDPGELYKPAFWLHGGAWVRSTVGSPGHPDIQVLLDNGYMVFSAEYRVVETETDAEHHCPKVKRAELEKDVLQAFSNAIFLVHWSLRDQVDVGHGFLLTGESSGGHMVAWLNRHAPDWVKNNIRAVVPINSPLSFVHSWWLLNGHTPVDYRLPRQMQFGTHTFNLDASEALSVLLLQDYANDKGVDDCEVVYGSPPTLVGSDCYHVRSDPEFYSFIGENTFLWYSGQAAPLYMVMSELDFVIAPEPAVEVCKWYGALQNFETTGVEGDRLFTAECGTTLNRIAIIEGGLHHDYNRAFWDKVLAWAESPALD